MSPRRASTGDAFDPRLADLEYLRKRAGLTPARLASRPAILALLDTLDPVTGAKKLDQLLDGLANDRRFDALRSAYGYSQGQASLTDRRQATARRYNRTPDAIRDWEDQAIGEVLLLLLAEKPQPPVPAPNYLMEHMTAEYTIVKRHFTHATHRRDIVVLALEAAHFRYGLNEEVELANVWGATATLESQTPTGPIYRLIFPKVLLRGDRHAFGWNEVRKPATPPPPTEHIHDQASQIFHQPATRYDLTVNFKQALPRRIWSFEQLAAAERPGKPTRGNLLIPNAKGVISVTFHGPHGGLSSGVGWKW